MAKNEIYSLKENIKLQREINMILYASIPMPSHEDPRNEKAESILAEWREGGKKLKKMVSELAAMEVKHHETVPERKVFVNGFGEATTRVIESDVYRRHQKRLDKRMFEFIGGSNRR